MTFKSGKYGNLYILKTFDGVYIVNPQKFKIDVLIYSTDSTSVYEDQDGNLKRVSSSAPVYKVENIPSGSYFKIEDIDPHEDVISGSRFFSINFYADEIHWGNGEVEKEGWKLELKAFREPTVAEKIDGLNRDDINKIEEKEVQLEKEHMRTEKE